MSVYLVTIKFQFNNVMESIREHPSPDPQAALRFFEKTIRKDLAIYQIDTITVEKVSDSDG